MNRIKNIKEMAKFRPSHIRYGQSIFNDAYSLYPNETNELRATEYDCYYDDSRIDLFLARIQQ